jgi:hypothetical protein
MSNPIEFANEVGQYIKKLLSDLIMGNFNEDQGTAAQLISGALYLIPVLDQILAVRDVAGTLFVIQRHGGLGKASLEQKVDLGFAAFGLIPELGALSKFVRPLYKDSKLLTRMTVPAVHLVESMRGVGKGGAVKWLKTLNWASHTQSAIAYANNALNTCINGFHEIADLPSWIPYSGDIRHLALQAEGGLTGFRGKLDTPIRQASGEIRGFIGKILGEHAARVAQAVGNNLSGTTRNTGAAHHSNHPAAKTTARRTTRTPAGRADEHAKIGGQNRVVAGKNTGTIVKGVLATAYDKYKTMKPFEQGFFGEHIADYYVIQHSNQIKYGANSTLHSDWGLHWNAHDSYGAAKATDCWKSEPRKLNDNHTPIFLCRPPKIVTARGIDAAWLTNRAAPYEFAITEAKASMSKHSTLYSMLNEANTGTTGTSTKPVKSGTGFKNRNKNKPNANTSKKPAKPKKKVMQMSHQWIKDRISGGVEYSQYRPRILSGPQQRNYSRHVFLITPEEMVDHLKIQAKIILEGLIDQPKAAQKYAHEHAEHKISSQFGEADLNAAEKTYKAQGKAKKSKGK